MATAGQRLLPPRHPHEPRLGGGLAAFAARRSQQLQALEPQLEELLRFTTQSIHSIHTIIWFVDLLINKFMDFCLFSTYKFESKYISISIDTNINKDISI